MKQHSWVPLPAAALVGTDPAGTHRTSPCAFTCFCWGVSAQTATLVEVINGGFTGFLATDWAPKSWPDISWPMNCHLGKAKSTHVTALSIRYATGRFKNWKHLFSLPHLVFKGDILIKPLNNYLPLSRVSSLLTKGFLSIFLPKLRVEVREIFPLSCFHW